MSFLDDLDEPALHRPERKPPGRGKMLVLGLRVIALRFVLWLMEVPAYDLALLLVPILLAVGLLTGYDGATGTALILIALGAAYALADIARGLRSLRNTVTSTASIHYTINGTNNVSTSNVSPVNPGSQR